MPGMRFNWITGKWDIVVPSTPPSGGTVTSISGGTGITNTPEPITTVGTVDLDINSLTTETTLADGDLFPFIDISAAGTPIAQQRKTTLAAIRGSDVDYYQTVQEEGSPLTQRGKLNFIGSAVTATDDGANDRTNVTITSNAGTVTSVAGGVGITNTPEPITGAGTVDLDINSLTTETAVADSDLFPFVDVSVGTGPSAQRKSTLRQLFDALGSHNRLLGMSQAAPGSTTVANPLLISIAPFGTTIAIGNTSGETFVSYTTGAAANAAAGWATSALICRLDVVASYYFRLLPVSTTDVRYWIGISGFAVASGAGNNPPNDFATWTGCWFRYSTSAGDTNWQAVTNAGGATSTITDTGIAFAAAPFTFRIRVVSTSSVEFYINGALAATHSTNLPASTTSLGHQCGVTSLAAAGKTVKVSRVWLVGELP